MDWRLGVKLRRRSIPRGSATKLLRFRTARNGPTARPTTRNRGRPRLSAAFRCMSPPPRRLVLTRPFGIRVRSLSLRKGNRPRHYLPFRRITSSALLRRYLASSNAGSRMLGAPGPTRPARLWTLPTTRVAPGNEQGCEPVAEAVLCNWTVASNFSSHAYRLILPRSGCQPSAPRAIILGHGAPVDYLSRRRAAV